MYIQYALYYMSKKSCPILCRKLVYKWIKTSWTYCTSSRSNKKTIRPKSILFIKRCRSFNLNPLISNLTAWSLKTFLVGVNVQIFLGHFLGVAVVPGIGPTGHLLSALQTKMFKIIYWFFSLSICLSNSFSTTRLTRKSNMENEKFEAIKARL